MGSFFFTSKTTFSTVEATKYYSSALRRVVIKFCESVPLTEQSFSCQYAKGEKKDALISECS